MPSMGMAAAEAKSAAASAANSPKSNKRFWEKGDGKGSGNENAKNERGAQEEPNSPIDPRQRQRDIEDEFRRGAYPIPIDLNGKLSAPFLLGRRRVGRTGEGGVGISGGQRSDSRGGNVRWKDLSDIEREKWRKASSGEEEKVRLDGSGSASLGGRRHSREERGDISSERERGDLKRRPSGHGRQGSHESERRRNRERDRAYDVRRERDRDRDRGGTSPVRGVDGRKYPPMDGWR